MVFKYPVPLLNGPYNTAPRPAFSSLFEKEVVKHKKRGKIGWVEEWKTTFHLNVESCHKSLFSYIFLKYIASCTISL